MEKVPDNSVRIKVTNDCQWTCTFCHNEGTELPNSANANYRTSAFLDPNILSLPIVENIIVSEDTIAAISNLKTIGIDEIHLTGGEPTLLPQLPSLIKVLSSQGFKVKLTTNGQVSNQRMQEIIESGLDGINFSILSLDEDEFLKTQNPPMIPGLDPRRWAKNMIEREKSNILLAVKLGVNVKINTAVLGKGDYSRVDSVREFAQEEGINLVLLNGIGEQDTAQDAVFEYAQSYAEYRSSSESSNNSKGSRTYAFPNGDVLRAKYLTNYHPEVVCGGCELRDTPLCAEKFYGIRMEFRGGTPFIRLCIQKTNERTVMPLQDFIAKDIKSQL